MKKINYKSDFEVSLRFFNCYGDEITAFDHDWEARFFTSLKVNAYTVMQKQGVLFNAYRAADSLNCIFDSHGLSQGVLQGEMCVHVPDHVYPDGKRIVVIPFETDIRLVAEAGDCCGRVGEVCITIPGSVAPPTLPGDCVEGIPLTNEDIDAAIDSV